MFLAGATRQAPTPRSSFSPDGTRTARVPRQIHGYRSPRQSHPMGSDHGETPHPQPSRLAFQPKPKPKLQPFDGSWVISAPSPYVIGRPHQEEPIHGGYSYPVP